MREITMILVYPVDDGLIVSIHADEKPTKYVRTTQENLHLTLADIAGLINNLLSGDTHIALP